MTMTAEQERQRQLGAGGASLLRVLELAEPVLEQAVGTVEVGAQASNGCGSVPACERLGACVAEKLPVNADEHVRRDLRVELMDAELASDRACEHLGVVRHDLELLRLQRGRLLDDVR